MNGILKYLQIGGLDVPSFDNQLQPEELTELKDEIIKSYEQGHILISFNINNSEKHTEIINLIRNITEIEIETSLN